MDHLAYVASSYALALLAIGWLALGAWARTARARRRLAAIDPRGARRMAARAEEGA